MILGIGRQIKQQMFIFFWSYGELRKRKITPCTCAIFDENYIFQSVSNVKEALRVYTQRHD